MQTNSHVNADFAKTLIAHNILNADELNAIITQAEQEKTPFVTYLAQHHLDDHEALAKINADFFGLRFVNLHQHDINTIPIDVIAESAIIQYQILPLKIYDNTLTIALSDPARLADIDALTLNLPYQIETVMVKHSLLKSYIQHAISQKHYQIICQQSEPGNDNAIIVFINNVLNDAIGKNASDIHFEPHQDTIQIRMRIDGLLHAIISVNITLINAIITRLKIMANLDITERRRPQDGRFTFEDYFKQTRDCRMNSCPTLFGEKVVLRLLNPMQRLLKIEELGMNKKAKTLFRQAINKPQGLILVTGPTGSGKTVTLYSALDTLNTSCKNITTIEHPVEIQLPGINQINVNYQTGLDFATALKACLRQDPDILMIGEIRDLETAENAIRAAQTGHLVFATLHTNNASEAITRLINVGIKPFNLAHSINLIIAQRLIRKLCKQCKTPAPKQVADKTVYQAQGCIHCLQGYSGRKGIFTVIENNAGMQAAILNNTLPVHDHTLWNAGMTAVHQGETSIEEIYRVIPQD